MKFLKIFSLCLLAISIAACSWFKSDKNNKSDELVDVRNLPPLKMPKGMQDSKPENYYPIPDLTANQKENKINKEKLLLPPDSILTKNPIAKT